MPCLHRLSVSLSLCEDFY